jgi:hypothetical protein
MENWRTYLKIICKRKGTQIFKIYVPYITMPLFTEIAMTDG